MPRRRMIDPSLTDDLDIAQLSFTERWFLVGALRTADDEGRLQGHPGFIKSQVFPYDDDIDNKTARQIMESALKKMETWRENNPWRLVLYKNGLYEYLAFPGWYQHQAPSHPQPSKLPAPPGEPGLQGERFTDELRQEVYERDSYICQYCGADLSKNARLLSVDHIIPLTRGGTHRKSNLATACKSCNLKKKNKTPAEAGMKFIPGSKVNLEDNPDANLGDNLKDNSVPTQVRLGQSSLGKVSIGQGSLPTTDNSLKNDLTDLTGLTTTLEKLLPAEPLKAIFEIKRYWRQETGKDLAGPLYQGVYSALTKYSLPVVMKTLAKAKYLEGKRNPIHYLQAVLDEQSQSQ